MSLIPFRTKRTSGMDTGNLMSMADFRNEMNRLFEGFFSRASSLAPSGFGPSWFETAMPAEWVPTVDLSETDTQIRVRAELPGIDPKDVDVSVSGDRLVISGEKKESKESSGEGWTHCESHYGAFSRAIPLPESVDPSKVTARYDKGVLMVDLTKSPSSTSRKVPVLAK
jgi:HSP20 family protein